MPSQIVNEALAICLVEEKVKKRGKYLKFLLREKAMIGKYTSENGIASVIFLFISVNQSLQPATIQK